MSADPTDIVSDVERFKVPDELMARWYAIPPDKPVTLTMPRQSYDLLFHAIASAYETISAVQHSTAYSMAGNQADADEALDRAADASASGHNSLRRFAAILMSMETGFVPDEALMEPEVPDE